ncbi:MAG: hypothetical protein QOJ00_2642 [Actinomycetota bacterium]|jgi:protein-tyrosine phosphatase
MSWLSERSRNGGIDEVPLPSGAGRLWLCGKHLIGPDPEATLLRTGASTVVCLNDEAELVHRFPEYVRWLRANADERAVWWPVHDMHAPGGDGLGSLVSLVRERLDAGEGVVVHCGAGMGRAGSVAAAVLIAYGEQIDDALAHVAVSRPGAGPQTIAQQLALEEYAKSM